MKKATLVLEDDSVFPGVSAGVSGTRTGEVVLNTAVVGYQEMMTDPANAGKILVLTYPLIGNYGVAEKFSESGKCRLAALVMKELSRTYSNWQAKGSLGDFFRREKVTALAGVDTRTLAVRIRERGEMPGIVTAGEEEAAARRGGRKALRRRTPDFIREISVSRLTRIPGKAGAPVIAVLDLGMLRSFIFQLNGLLGCRLILLPWDTGAEKILALSADGLLVSGGPEEDAALPAVVETVTKVLGRMPLLGISTGAEVIALAAGGRRKKMKLGHRGVNYPVKPAEGCKGEITVQNHSFAVEESSLPSRVKVTLRNLNDRTVEEMESGSLNFIAAQYYPVSPGAGEVNGLFKRFLKLIGKRRR